MGASERHDKVLYGKRFKRWREGNVILSNYWNGTLPSTQKEVSGLDVQKDVDVDKRK